MAGAGGSPLHLLGMLFSLTDSLQLPGYKDKRKLLPSDFSNRGPQPARQFRNDRVRQATPGAWSAAVGTAAPLWSSSSFQYFWVLQEAPRTPSSLQPAKKSHSSSTITCLLPHNPHLPLCATSVLLGIPSLLSHLQLLIEKNASCPQVPAAGWYNRPHPERTCTLTPAQCLPVCTDHPCGSS